MAKLQRPAKAREVRSILGMAGYYRTSILDFAHWTEPLVRLTRKGQPFKWTPECEAGFAYLKKALTNHPVMAYPDPVRPFRLYTDACTYVVGAILVQADENGVQRPIHYHSQQLNDVHRR